MDVAQDLIFTTGAAFKLTMTIDSSILLKNHVSYNLMLKYYITILLRQFTKTYLNLPRQTNIWKFACLFYLRN